MGLFGKRHAAEPAATGWDPVEASCSDEPAVLYFHQAMPGAVICVTVSPVSDDDGAPTVRVTAEWQIRRAPRYIAADTAWRFTHSELLPPRYESPQEAADDAAVIMKWLLRGVVPGEIMPSLDSHMAALLGDWDGQPW